MRLPSGAERLLVPTQHIEEALGPHAMARRHILGWKQLTEHVKKLPPLMKGDDVFLQNLMGNHPRRWDRIGKAIECKEYDQSLVKVDSSGQTTLRNRKHFRKFKPVRKAVPPLWSGFPDFGPDTDFFFSKWSGFGPDFVQKHGFFIKLWKEHLKCSNILVCFDSIILYRNLALKRYN